LWAILTNYKKPYLQYNSKRILSSRHRSNGGKGKKGEGGSGLGIMLALIAAYGGKKAWEASKISDSENPES
jgi:hypothetical protein